VNSRFNILFVTHRVPFPPDKEDRARDFHLLRLLGRYADVHLASLSDGPAVPEAAKHLSGEAVRFAAIPLRGSSLLRGIRAIALGGTISEAACQSKEFATTVQQWTAETRFDAAIASASSVAHYLRLPGLESARKIADLGNLESHQWADGARNTWAPKSWAFALEGRRLDHVERRVCSWVDAVTLASEAEAAALRQATGSANVHAVTNGVDLNYFSPSSPGADRGLVFIGALDSAPVVDGISWFARTVWPNLRQQWPDVRLTIVGSRPNAAARELAEIPGVDIPGQVTDVRTSLDQAAVVIAPARIARGISNNVLEAMAIGKPVVASAVALAGFGVRPDLPARPATELDEWVETIRWLLGDQDARYKLGHMGRAYVERFHKRSTCLEPFIGLLPSHHPAPRGRAV